MNPQACPARAPVTRHFECDAVTMGSQWLAHCDRRIHGPRVNGCFRSKADFDRVEAQLRGTRRRGA